MREWQLRGLRGFFFECSPADFKKNAIHQQAVEVPISAVERRIKLGDFANPVTDIDIVQRFQQTGRWKPNMHAKRIILAGGNRPVCSWGMEIDENGADRIAM